MAKIKGDVLPEDWEPSDNDRAYGAKKCSLTGEQIDEMAEDMRLWAGANAHRQVARKTGLRGWSMAFKSWMRREAKKFGGIRHETDRSLGAVAARLADQPGFSFGPKPRLVLPDASRDDVRLLPKK